MGLLDLFGFGKKKMEIQEFLDNGAVIVDVRSQAEFSQGHVDGSLNVPLDSIKHKTSKLKKLNKSIILCCASGMRSSSAQQVLKSAGIECTNGGSWKSLA